MDYDARSSKVRVLEPGNQGPDRTGPEIGTGKDGNEKSVSIMSLMQFVSFLWFLKRII